MSSTYGAYQDSLLGHISTQTTHHTTNHSKLEDVKNKLDDVITNTANIKVSTDSVNLNVDGLEALQTSANNTLSSIDNKVILPSVLDSDRLKVYDSAVIGSLAQINNNVDGVESKLDDVITNTTGLNNCVSGNELQVDIVSGSVTASVTGVSTEAKQDTINNTLGDIGNKIDAMRSSDSLTTLKASVDATETTLNAIETSLSNVATDNSILSMRVREDDAHVNRQYLIGCGVVRQDSLASLCDADNDTTMLSVNSSGALYTQPASHEVSLHSTDRTHLSEIEGAVETIEGCVGLNKMNVNLSSDAVGLATSTNQTNGTAITKIMGSEDATTSGVQRQIHVDGSGNLQCNVVNTIFQTPSNSANSHITDDPANSMAVGMKARTTIGTASSEVFLRTESTGALNVAQKKTYSSEVVYISSQSVSGTGTHTGATIVNDPNNEGYIVEHNFSGSDVSFSVEVSIDGTNFFPSGLEFNMVGDPMASITGINDINGIKAPYLRIKFTNGNASSRDVTLSYVSIQS